ncbi:hypothetical protein SKAU_G00143430 [Synaphobranchus kaupii]|uniref:Uncharacterized protein n=1 Tax=Synaphobranchus kaupii TaxID=118154 RepID=A0A9Q1FSS7_SYNKA|nr:hypothetical protein SKAU_G00143430 [Synaphobranchus kaupii]
MSIRQLKGPFRRPDHTERMSIQEPQGLSPRLLPCALARISSAGREGCLPGVYKRSYRSAGPSQPLKYQGRTPGLLQSAAPTGKESGGPVFESTGAHSRCQTDTVAQA